MKLQVDRFAFSDECTIGRMSINDEYFCWTLEDPFRVNYKVFGETCIPGGLYKVIIDESNRFKRRMPHILDVPNFTGIRIHKGNTAANTKGCILVGYKRTNNSVFESGLAFDALFDKLDVAEHNEDPIYLLIREVVETEVTA